MQKYRHVSTLFEVFFKCEITTLKVAYFLCLISIVMLDLDSDMINYN